MCDNLIKYKIGIMNKIITISYKSVHLLIQFIFSTINIYISESHCSAIATATKYPHRSFNSIQSIHYRSEKIYHKKLPLHIALLTIQPVHRKELPRLQ